MLLDSAYEPITVSIGFLKKPLSNVVEEHLKWQREIYNEISKNTGIHIETRSIRGGLKDALEALLPLVSIGHSRMVFVPTASEWTAYFDNNWRGTDPVAPMRVLAKRLICEGMRVTAVHHHMPKKVEANKRRAYGAAILEVYDSHGNDHRTVYAANDGGRWVFGQSGKPYSFEHISAYSAQRTRDRFTIDMLEGYLKELGLDAFNENWYVPEASSESVLISFTGIKPVKGYRYYTLQEARED